MNTLGDMRKVSNCFVVSTTVRLNFTKAKAGGHLPDFG